MRNKGAAKGRVLAVLLLFLLVLGMLAGCTEGIREPGLDTTSGSADQRQETDFYIVAGPEMQNIEGDLVEYGKQNGVTVRIAYMDSMAMMQQLNEEKISYDAALVSNSIWKYMLNSSYTLSNSKIVAINPVVFAVTKAKAQELGFVDADVYMRDIVTAVDGGRLRFLMGSATQTNSGASTYLSFLNVLAGNPEILTANDLQQPALREGLKTLFSGIARTSGSEEYVQDLFMTGEYDSMVGYESAIIEINEQLAAQNKDPLYLIYPVDGVSVSDVTFGFVAGGSEEKQAQFSLLQEYLLSEEMQQKMAVQGHRTGFGGVIEPTAELPFKQEWGIDTTQYLSPVKYPSSVVIKEAFSLYQDELKKPSITVFCLDYSGSMSGDGVAQLTDAMQYILTHERAAADFIQFGSNDKICLVPFDSTPRRLYEGSGEDTDGLLYALSTFRVNGGTDIYAAGVAGISYLQKIDNLDDYLVTLVIMTDGQSSGRPKELTKKYTDAGIDMGVYCIGFGDAEFNQLDDIAEYCNGKVFDGRTDLLKAFQTVRGFS